MEAASSHHLMKRVIDSKTPQECLTTVASPKPNQVGTVLLYGIPIVSLYIEAQERLCLAQISNTLLKQFSYNEIHNRRVALGITCVQCTPVQLEILRRAGAMPVSSRRCGMITRREAERLCKSFLGDNAPPRLPEDFAFSVHHECAWGCRGSFLPSRYNSSRAKCIKCAYCGLFFSPNKFIFHSHRIGPGDKYVQPDAANFNSWRRHMKLSGNPPEEIVHAWEDVKAMFNGGTRKRLMTTSPSSQSSTTSPKRMKETQITPPLIQAAAAAAVVSAAATANAAQFPIRPVNIHPSPTAPNTATAGRIPGLGTTELPLPFSRSFMMDYMWHAQTKSNSFQFPNYALPWIKRPGSLLFNQQNASNSSPNREEVTASNFNHIAGCAAAAAASNAAAANGIEHKSMPFYNNSAFKPVINQARTSFSSTVALAISALDEDQRTVSRNSREEDSTIKESLSSDDEMVDIETTEEEEHTAEGNCLRFKNPRPESPIVEIENSNDMGWEGIMKKEHGNIRNAMNIHSITPTQSLQSSHSPSSSSLASDLTTTTGTTPIINVNSSPLPTTSSAAAAAAAAAATMQFKAHISSFSGVVVDQFNHAPSHTPTPASAPIGSHTLSTPSITGAVVAGTPTVAAAAAAAAIAAFNHGAINVSQMAASISPPILSANGLRLTAINNHNNCNNINNISSNNNNNNNSNSINYNHNHNSNNNNNNNGSGSGNLNTNTNSGSNGGNGNSGNSNNSSSSNNNNINNKSNGSNNSNTNNNNNNTSNNINSNSNSVSEVINVNSNSNNLASHNNNNNIINNNNNNNSINNSNSNSSNTINNNNTSTNNNNNNNNNNNCANNNIIHRDTNELWSVARFSFDRPDYRIPFYRHDITKHFQAFRHGETTTQTNGIG